MTGVEILTAFELEINELDNDLTKPLTDDSLYWINQAVGKFVKTRFNGDQVHHTGYEQTEKRRTDLDKLFTEYVYQNVVHIMHVDYVKCKNVYLLLSEDDDFPGENYFVVWSKKILGKTYYLYNHVDLDNNPDGIDTMVHVYIKDGQIYANEHIGYDMILSNQNVSYDKYDIPYPPDFLYALNEDVIISDNNDEHEMNTCVFECTQDSFMYRINNSLTDFHYRNHRARPLRTRTADGCCLYTDKNYKVKQYTLGYLKKPSEITLTNPNNDLDYTDFEKYQYLEIVKIAAQMYLENKKSDRYLTITNEVLTQE